MNVCNQFQNINYLVRACVRLIFFLLYTKIRFTIIIRFLVTLLSLFNLIYFPSNLKRLPVPGLPSKDSSKVPTLRSHRVTKRILLVGQDIQVILMRLMLVIKNHHSVNSNSSNNNSNNGCPIFEHRLTNPLKHSLSLLVKQNFY